MDELQRRSVTIMVSAAIAFSILILSGWSEPALAGDVGAKLKALDNAYRAGVLTEQEYKAKRAALDDASGSKLKALEDAYRAGVLTEQEYKAKRAALTGTPDSVAGSKRNQPGQLDLTPGRRTGRVYNHPTGISVWIPDGWRTRMLEGVLEMVPPGAAATADAYETYYLTADDMTGSGIDRIGHPSVAASLDEKMYALGQALGGLAFQRTGGPNPLNTPQGAGQGVSLEYAAQSNIGPIKGRIYAAIIKNYGMSMAGVGVKDLLDQRAPMFERIFASIGVGQGKNDPALVGVWQLMSTRSITNNSVWETDWSRARMVSDNVSRLTFRPDGSWERLNSYHMIAGAGSTWIESKDKKAYRGRWNADVGHLFMIWEDQSFDDYQYRIRGGQLEMRSGNKAQLWRRVN